MVERQANTIWETEGAQKRHAVRQMFADIAPSYDRLNHVMSVSLHHRWRDAAVAMLGLLPGERVADICCGTGDFFRPLRRAVGLAGKITGVDFCPPMLSLAGAKKDALDVTLAVGDACHLPIATQSVDAVTVGWGIRNVPDIDAAHREIFRVLRPGGRFVSLDMARPRGRMLRAISEFVFNSAVPRLGTHFGKTDAYTYLPKSTQRFWTRQQLAGSMESAGFRDVRHRDLMLGNLCIHFGRKPQGQTQ